MARRETFQCTVITPERRVLDCEARFVAFPAHDGELGVLVNRAPLVCKLGIGLLRVETANGRHVMMVDEGFAQVVDNRLTILTESTAQADDLDVAEVEQLRVEARAMRIPDEAGYRARSKAIQRAQVQLRLVRTEGSKDKA
ncbi:MAG: ATP synthase F1 subunit epsilon [Planctomycetes bacterium]|nr:ATP synthase F1 subunit epsilon [Planctomycetota bacterium]